MLCGNRRVFVVGCMLFVVFGLLLLSVNAYSAGTLANTQILNGGDAGTANVADTAGDTLVQWVLGNTTNYATSPVVEVKVSTGFAISALPTPSNQTLTPGATANYAYYVCNLANAVDTMTLSVSTVAGQPWTVKIIKDDNGDGIRGVNENTEITSTGELSPDTTFYFFVSVNIPADASDGSNSTVRLTVKNQSGLGTEDNWPIDGNDIRESDTVTSCAFVSLQLVKGTNRATARPFTDEIVYTSTITAVGSGIASNVIYKDKLPSQTTYVSGSIVKCIWGTGGSRSSVADSEAWDGTNQLITVNLGDLTAGTSAYVEFRVRVK